ncbi:MAG: DEAD/DEAH box helicase [Chitinophagaceae bacterium]|nr:DEAD/DEAH box helicase [Chitinophagaceae bacterium]
MTFEDFHFDPDVEDGLISMGYKTPTPIQEQAIPIILDNHDLIACAQTGTGKTAAYLLPLLHKIITSPVCQLNTLILAPTRELAQQIDQQIDGLAYYMDISSIPIYGGGSGDIWVQQKRALDKGVDIVIATPGRLISHLSSGAVKMDDLKHLVLDEADRMLDMGFYDDIIRIISHLPKERQTLLFSATMPPKIRKLAEAILNKPQEVNIAISKPAEGIDQRAYLVHDEDKVDLLKLLLAEGDYNSIIIFASTKENVKKLDRELHKSNLNAKAFHADLEQSEREALMNKFKARKVPILIGTDVLSRGIDVEGIDLVINYDVPPDAEDYVHRIGRTARAERKGTAITFINKTDQDRFSRIERLIERELEKTPNPAPIPEGPAYTPRSRKGGGKKKFYGKRNGGGSHHKKPHNKGRG